MKKIFSIIGRIIRAAWNAVTLSRRAVGNLLFIAFVLILVVVVFFDRETRVPKGAALVLSPVGNIVEQASEQLLMDRFYSNHFKQGMSAPAALREAQLWLRDTTEGDYASPFYWAAFTCTGL